MIDKLKNTISSIKNKTNNASMDLKTIVETNKAIDEVKSEKASILLEMGMLTYRKIRENTLVDCDYNDLSNQIMELDKIIYAHKLEVEQIKNAKIDTLCECGNVIGSKDNFCSECGNQVEVEENINLVTCKYCSYEIDSDSSYCPCCGNKNLIEII